MQAPADGQHFAYSTYAQASGLTNLNVSALIQDRHGTIWVGTESGVFLADGTRFVKLRAFEKVHLELTRAMHEDPAGRIWIMDSRHLVYWQDGTVRAIENINLKLLSAGDVALISLSQDPDAVYVLRDGELLRVATSDKGRTWQVSSAVPASLLAQHLELRTLTSVFVEGSLIWAGCGQALCRLDLSRGTVQVFSVREGVTPDQWKRLLFTRNGSLWARGNNHLLKLDLGSSHFLAVSLPAHSDLNVQQASLEEDGDGNVVLNLARGVASTDGTVWHLYTHSSGLPVDEIQSLMFARSGELWLAPLGHGITRWHGYGNWEGWTTSEGMSSDVVWSTARDRWGRIWTVNHAGLDKLDPGHNTIEPQKTSIPFGRLYTVVVDQRQHIWTGNDKGQVIDFDPASGKGRVTTAGLGRIFRLHIDKRQRIWVCSRAGLYFFSSDDGWRNPRPGGSDLMTGYAWDITEGPDGTLWVSTGRGLFRFNDGRWQQIQLPFPGGTGYNFMIAAAPDGTLWSQSKLPTPVLHLSVKGNAAKVIDLQDTSALTSDNITFVDTDSRGWIWVGNDDGVSVYNGRRWVQCTQDDGLLWDDTDFHAFSADPDGSVWIGTSAGLSHLKYPERIFAEAPPVVQIEEIHLANLEISNTASNGFDLRRPTLNVRLVNTNYDRRTSIVYRFKLEGLDGEWQETDGGSFRFPALDAGRYVLKVIAYDQRLHLASTQTMVPFTVLEPWWRRTWSRVLEGLAGLAFVIAAWRFSVHLLVLRQRELELLVADRTLELEREKSELLAARSALLETTRRDSLTGLLNRAAVFDQMKSLCEKASNTGLPLAVAMADLDSFKSINDTYGHVFGDAVLRECAARIERAVRPADSVGRYGGEELLILMPGLQRSDAPHRMEDLRLALAQEPITYGELSVTVTCSFGVAWFDLTPIEVEALIGQADAALYLAKERGRNRVEFARKNSHLDEQFDPMATDGSQSIGEKNSSFPNHEIDTSKRQEAVDSAAALA